MSADYAISTTQCSSPSVTNDDRMLTCCKCSSALDDPMQLKCLHSCCRVCLVTAKEREGMQHITCTFCAEATAVADVVDNTFLFYQLQRRSFIMKAENCGPCTDDDIFQKAVTWCKQCGKSFCENCENLHKHILKDHVTTPIVDIHKMDVYPIPLLQCKRHPDHPQPAESICINCKASLCKQCVLECSRNDHRTMNFSHSATEKHAESVRKDMCALEETLRRHSASLVKIRSLKDDLKNIRRTHLNQLMVRKLKIMELLEEAYKSEEEVIKKKYDDLDAIAEYVQAKALGFECRVTQAVKYCKYLREAGSVSYLLDQQHLLFERLASLSSDAEALLREYNETYPSLDLTQPSDQWQKALDTWIQIPFQPVAVGSATQLTAFETLVFDTPSACFEAPVSCCDVAVLYDGRLILAALQNGLLEYCTEGHELSRWIPPKKSAIGNDWVLTVAALSDGRAAAGLHAGLIVLLQRSSPSDSWVEDGRIEELHSSPWHTCVYGDVLAVAEKNSSSDKRSTVARSGSEWLGIRNNTSDANLTRDRKQFREPAVMKRSGSVKHDTPDGTSDTNITRVQKQCGELLLVNLTSLKLLSRQIREYDIRGIAVTADAVFTISNKITLDYKIKVAVVDAYTHCGQSLWRYKANDMEEIRGIGCATDGNVVYLTVRSGENSRVATLSAADGKELQKDVASNATNLQDWEPWRLSLAIAGDKHIAAILSWNNRSLTIFSTIASKAVCPLAAPAASLPVEPCGSIDQHLHVTLQLQ